MQFYSLRLLFPAIPFLAVAHLCDMLVEHPSIRLSEYVGMPLGSFKLVIAILGNSLDTVGITFLIYGFMKIIKYKRAEEKLRIVRMMISTN